LSKGHNCFCEKQPSGFFEQKLAEGEPWPGGAGVTQQHGIGSLPPQPRGISTGDGERQNLSARMHMRRFTRLTNAFSKKVDNHRWAVVLHFMHYNFCRVHQTLA